MTHARLQRRAGAIALAVTLLGASGCGARESVVIDLVERFPQAETKRPSADVFTLVDATLAGVTHRAIQSRVPSRIGWKLTVPDDGWLDVSIGLREDAWTTEGDGVLFMIGVSDGEAFHEIMSLVVNPFANPGDRGWHPLQLDLTAFAGKPVDIIFNTYSSPAGQPVDDRGDQPVWGAPRVVVR